MEIRAAMDIDMGIDILSPLSPLVCSLYDSFLSSHCSGCFSPLSPPPHSPPHAPTLLYCSTTCSRIDSPIVFPKILPDVSPLLPSDIRAALRLLHSISFSTATASLLHRVGGLLTNHHRLMADSSISLAVKSGANLMATVLRSQGNWSDGEDTKLEEAVICSVLTNAVEVQDGTGRALGIAVYDTRFSWINHSCSPNACYRFVISAPSTTSHQDDLGISKTVPHITKTEKEEVGVCSISTRLEGKPVGYGPQVIVRSIKGIKSGEEITVSYVDLLQPRALRQSDLWSKYRFMCSCGRCARPAPAYVDSMLEGVLALDPDKTTVDQQHGTTNKDEAVEKMTDHINEAIDEFLSNSIDPETCCEKIENVLHHGFQIKHSCETNKTKSQPHLWLHPMHHVSLNAYITLASAYRIRSIDSESEVKAFELRRISAAYSLFLAGISHFLFISEPSLAISAATFWTSAGESLLDLTQNRLMESSGEYDVKCSKCHVLETLNSHSDVKEKSSQLMKCVTEISQVTWSFLSRGCPYLQKFRSPVDFSFVDEETKESSEEQSVNIPQLSFHSLLYADLLTQLCYGQKSDLVSRFRQTHC